MGTIIETSLRYRVNVTQTSTGKKGFDCTVEVEGKSVEEVLERSDELVKALESRYPPEEQKKPIEKPTKTAQAVETGTPPADTP